VLTAKGTGQVTVGPSALEQYEYMENAGQARLTQLPNYVRCTSPPQRGSEVYQSQEDGVAAAALQLVAYEEDPHARGDCWACLCRWKEGSGCVGIRREV